MASVQCVILAGGLGTRVQTINSDVPKALLPVGGRPFIHWQLDWLKRQTVESVVICIGYKGARIRASVLDGVHWGIDVRYVDEGPHLLGTGGALRAAAEQGALDRVVAVLYGDSLLQVGLQRVHSEFLRREQPALMTVLRNHGRWGMSNVSLEGSEVTRYEKSGCQQMEWIDYGLTLLRRETLESYLDAGSRCDLGVAYSRLAREGCLGAYEATQRFYEVGSPEGVRELDDLLRSGWVPALERL